MAFLNASAGGTFVLPEGRQDKLFEQVQELEALRTQFGAPQIEQEKPGFLARTVDALSGANFAIAGAYEELAQGNSPGAAVARATRELYSSARSLPFGQLLPEIGGAEKRAFGQVLEGLGHGTTTLGQVIPALEGTFIGELFNSRGTVGVALDIMADPLTYMTFGVAPLARRTMLRFAKFGLKKGVNKKGLDRLNELERSIRKAGRITDPGDITTEAVRRFSETADKSLFDPGGLKFAGWVVPGTPGVGKEILDVVTTPVVKTMNRFGIGQKVVRAGESSWDAMKSILRETFSEFGALEKLPEAQREAARQIARKYVPARSQLYGRYVERIKNSGFVEYFRANPERAKPVMDMLDSGKRAFLNQQEADAAGELTEFLREIAGDGVAAGIFKEAQVDRPSYIFHRYENKDLEDMPETWMGMRGTLPKVAGKHAKQRHYDTLVDAERISGQLEMVSKAGRALGIPVPIYKKLIPDYNLESGLLKYIDWFSGQKAHRGLVAEMGREFGWEVSRFEKVIDALFDGANDIIEETHDAWAPIKVFFGKHGSLAKLSEEAATFAKPIGQLKDARIAGWPAIVQDSKGLLGRIDDDGKRQFFKEMFQRIKSPAQFVDVWRSFDKEFGQFFPKATVDLTGEAEDALKLFGESANYVEVGANSIWGKNPMLVPRLIQEYVENANARIFNTKDFEGWRKGLQVWRRINNSFKTWVYPYFPASAFRDKYSNLFLAGSRIGWHAISPELRGHSIAVLTKSKRGKRALQQAIGDGFTAKNGRRYTHDEVLDLMEQNNVLIEGRQWAELTEDGTHRIVNQKPLAQIVEQGDVGEIARNIPQPFTKEGRHRALELRARLDNDDRAALFIQDLMDGLTPQEAAADVAEFLFNYNELGAIHRDFVRDIIPFATFTIKNIKLQTRLLRTQPGLVINQLKPFRGRRDENEQMIKFEAEGLKLRIDKDGKTIRALTGIDLPLRNLDTLWAGGFGATGRRFMGMMSPVIKTPIEVLTGRNLFTGQRLDRATGNTLGRIIEATNTPQPIRNWLGYTKEHDQAGRPIYRFDGLKYQLLVRSYIFSRLISVSDRQFREYLSDGNIAGAMLDVTTGLRDKDINFDEQQRSLLFKRRRELVESLSRRGVLRPFEVPGKPRTEGTEF